MPKKRTTKRADGRIAVQVYVGRDENGKRKYVCRHPHERVLPEIRRLVLTSVTFPQSH